MDTSSVAATVKLDHPRVDSCDHCGSICHQPRNPNAITEDQTLKPRLGDLASTIVHEPWEPSNDVPGRAEAWDAVWDGCYTDYLVCPPGTTLENADTDYLHASVVYLEHSDSNCTVFRAMYF